MKRNLILNMAMFNLTGRKSYFEFKDNLLCDLPHIVMRPKIMDPCSFPLFCVSLY